PASDTRLVSSHAKYKEQDDGLKINFKNTTIISPLRGRFNAENIRLAAAAAHALGISEQDIKKGVENVTGIRGRVEFVRKGQQFDVVVDYAHTPDSLEALYDAFKGKTKICVLGN